MPDEEVNHFFMHSLCLNDVDLTLTSFLTGTTMKKTTILATMTDDDNDDGAKTTTKTTTLTTTTTMTTTTETRKTRLMNVYHLIERSKWVSVKSKLKHINYINLMSLRVIWR